MFSSFLHRAGFAGSAKKAGYIAAIALVVIYGLVALRGPQGIQTLLDKHREIRQLEEQNANAALENQRRRERIQRLESSTSEQEMEIRKQLKLLRPGETTFILPDAPKNGDASQQANPQAVPDSAPVAPPQ